jgi:dienelactone hydrolase
MFSSRALKWIVGLPAAVAALLVAVAWYFSSLVLYPPVHCNPDHHVYCGNPSEIGLAFEDVQIPTSDGLKMQSWYIPAERSTKAIVMVHGHGGLKNEGLRFSRALHDAGYNLLLLDLRRNSGGSATMGYLESRDVIRALDFLSTEKKNEKLGIFGFSMGAATSILSMAADQRVRAGLFSSGYASAVDVLSEAAARDYHLPYYPLFPVMLFVGDHRAHIELEAVRPVDVIGGISPRPISIFHCDKDDYVDSSHAQRLFAAAREPKEVWTPPCNRHERIWNVHREEAERRAVAFFKKNL